MRLARHTPIGMLATLVLACGAVLACGGPDTSTPTPPADTPTPPADTPTATPAPATPTPPASGEEPVATAALATPTPAPAEGGEEELDIANFELPSVTVAAGTEVTWTNRDGAPHTATEGGPGAVGDWDSGTLAQGAAFSFTFEQPGQFAYFCVIHPSMRGTITVEGSAASETTAQPAPTPTPFVLPDYDDDYDY
ncbi:MAG: plastocyanin/azurin family copper-binding protein [Dehalococcoidia bacterium]